MGLFYTRVVPSTINIILFRLFLADEFIDEVPWQTMLQVDKALRLVLSP